jgi:hypothetical protein
MSLDISSKNEARLKATAQAEGVFVDASVESLRNEQEEFVTIVERASAPSRRAGFVDSRFRQPRLQCAKMTLMNDGPTISAS